jgi:hypothetical protein
VLERLNQLETTVERLEMDAAERQLAVLNAVEKTMHQLRARESKRERDQAAAEGEVPALRGAMGLMGATETEALPRLPHSTEISAPLARRFKRW